MLSEDIIEQMKLRDFTCPDKFDFDKDYLALGNIGEDYYSWTDVKIKQCVKNNCLENDEMKKKIESLNVELLFMNANFDPKSLVKPIAYFPDTSLYQELVPGVKKVFQIDLRREKAILMDDVFGLRKKTEPFYEVK